MIDCKKFSNEIKIVSKNDMEFDRQTEFNIVRMIVDCVELYEKE